MTSLFLISALLLSVACDSEFWFTPNSVEISDVVFERNKPLQLPKKHNKVSLTHVEGTIYSESLSQLDQVVELEIVGGNVSEIEDGALCATSSVKILELNFHNTYTLPKLTKTMFANCSRLERLYLTFRSEDDDYELDLDAIEHLNNLQELFIEYYNITHLHSSFLKINSSALVTLGLIKCNICAVADNFLENFPKLENLAISGNEQLVQVPADLFDNVPNLRNLVLENNALENLTWHEFEGLKKLERLDLAKNRIREFDAEKIARTMPNLRKIEIELNPVPMDEREQFSKLLQTKMEHVVLVKYECDYGESCEENN